MLENMQLRAPALAAALQTSSGQPQSRSNSTDGPTFNCSKWEKKTLIADLKNIFDWEGLGQEFGDPGGRY